MIADFFARLFAAEPEPLPDPDARVALAAMLVRLARADGDYAPDEIKRIDLVLSHRYGVSAAEAVALRREAEEIEAHAPDTVRFTRAIKDAVPYEERESVIEALWEVALADGLRDHTEDAMIRLVAPMLGVTDQDSALARQRVEARLG